MSNPNKPSSAFHKASTIAYRGHAAAFATAGKREEIYDGILVPILCLREPLYGYCVVTLSRDGTVQYSVGSTQQSQQYQVVLTSLAVVFNELDIAERLSAPTGYRALVLLRNKALVARINDLSKEPYVVASLYAGAPWFAVLGRLLRRGLRLTAASLPESLKQHSVVVAGVKRASMCLPDLNKLKSLEKNSGKESSSN